MSSTTALSVPVRGALWMIGSAAGFAAMSAMIRPASVGLDAFEVVFFRNLFGLAFIAPILVRSRFAVLRTTRLPLHLARAVFFLCGMTVWFIAIPHIALVDAISLYFTSPLFITVLAALVLKERVRARRWTAVVIGLFGALVILRPGFQDVSSAAILVLVNAAFWSCSAIMVRLLSRTESATTIITHMFLWVTPLSLIPALFVWREPSLDALAWTVGVSASSAFGHWCLARAFTTAEASVIMPFDYTQLLFGALIGFFAFGEIPDAWTFAGAGIIAGAAIYIAQREAAHARAGSTAAPR
jgi:drug/metabolite transporter (DMT)-like permease